MQTFIGGNAITLLRSGAEYFPAVADAINQARRSVYIETYIFADDTSGKQVADALIAAASRGIDVGLDIHATSRLIDRVRDSRKVLRAASQQCDGVTANERLHAPNLSGR